MNKGTPPVTDPSITFFTIETTDPLYQQLAVFRNEVLYKPIGLNIFDEDYAKEDDCVTNIILATTTSKSSKTLDIVGCIILQPYKANIIKLRQLGVAPEFRGQSIGRKLVHLAEQIVQQAGINCIQLDALGTTKGHEFYSKLGYHVISEEFIHVGQPHFKMEKILF